MFDDFQVNSQCVQYKPGQVVTGKIKYAHYNGIGLEVNGCADAIVSARSLGKQYRSREDVARYVVGSSFAARVTAFHSKTRQLVLAPICANADGPPDGKKTVGPRKPQYELLPKGTVLVFDTANLLGYVGPEHAARVMKTIKRQLREWGYEAVLLIEERALDWYLASQLCETEKDELKEFAALGGVALVDVEADLPLLQFLRALPNSIGVTKDKFADYKDVYGELVGSSRIRSFTWVKIGGKLLVSVYGLKDAIEVSMLSEQEVENPRAVVPESDLGTEPRTAETVEAKNVGADPELEATSVEVSDWRIEKTMKASSIRRRMVGMLRSRNFEEYCELADMYTECDYEKEVYKESRHSGLSFRTMRRKRQQKLRTQRKLAAQHRVGLPFRFAGKVATATRINAILRKCA